jgi:hypothetical protein
MSDGGEELALVEKIIRFRRTAQMMSRCSEKFVHEASSFQG